MRLDLTLRHHPQRLQGQQAQELAPLRRHGPLPPRLACAQPLPGPHRPVLCARHLPVPAVEVDLLVLQEPDTRHHPVLDRPATESPGRFPEEGAVAGLGGGHRGYSVVVRDRGVDRGLAGADRVAVLVGVERGPVDLPGVPL